MKNFKITKLLIFLLLMFFVVGCRQQEQENILKKDIVEVLEQYRRGVNECDTVLLGQIVSDKFLAANGWDKNKYLDNLVKREQLIDDIQITSLQVNNYKIIAELTVQGSKLYFPVFKSPLFQDNPSLMEGSFKQKTTMVFIYEDTGLKIFAEEEGILFQDFSWGQALPELSFVSLNKESVMPGDEVAVSFYSGKGYNNEIMFVYLNDRLLHSYYAESPAVLSEERQTFRVPAQAAKNSFFELTISAYAGKMDINKPQSAVLQGVVTRKIFLPVK